MDVWWGDGERRNQNLLTADVMYRAGSGDTSVMPDLARMAVDRTQGALLRASAADYIAQNCWASSARGAMQSQTSFGSGWRPPVGAPAAGPATAAPR
jgi:hypothetical protein